MFERSYFWPGRLFMFVHHYASGEVSCGMLTKVCESCINYLKLLCFLYYPLILIVWSHIFTGCSQGGKVTFRNTLTVMYLTRRHTPCESVWWEGGICVAPVQALLAWSQFYLSTNTPEQPTKYKPCGLGGGGHNLQTFQGGGGYPPGKS